MSVTSKYTVVQHSGFVVGMNPEFEKGLEQKTITAKQEVKVREFGGLVFDDYTEADDYAMDEQYPPNVVGLIPQAPGMFSNYKVDGLPLYIPVPSS